MAVTCTLYEEVWAEPMTKIAARYGVSPWRACALVSSKRMGLRRASDRGPEKRQPLIT